MRDSESLSASPPSTGRHRQGRSSSSGVAFDHSGSINGNHVQHESSLGSQRRSAAAAAAEDDDEQAAPAGTSYGQRNSNEKTPLLFTNSTAAAASIGPAAESLANTSVVAAGDMQTGVSWRMAAFLLVNTALGAGMLNYPYAYNQIGGVAAAALMQVVLLVFITSTMFILVYCADINRDDTYHDVLLSMCGKRAQQISATSILLTCYGINITFLVIIGDQFDRIFNSLMTPEQLETYWFMDRKFTIFLTSTLFIWPMCYARRLDFLRHASVLGMFAMLYVAFLTVYEHYKLDEDMIKLVTSSLAAASLPQHGLGLSTHTTTTTTTTTSTVSPSVGSMNSTGAGTGAGAANESAAVSQFESLTSTSTIKWFEPLAIIPVLCFAYQTHEVIVPVYACMKDRFIGNFMKASIFGLIILFFLYNLVGAFGYLTFGERVGADIMSLYDAKDPVVVVGIVALVIKFITTYPPLMFCGRSALDGLYGELRKMSTSEFKSSEPRRRYVITTLWFASSVAIAVFAPDISITLQLLGSMASINVFVFPGMCLWSLTRRLRRARQALLMGELPEGTGASSMAAQQKAKDYHLISGSYFGAAMKSNQAQAALLSSAIMSAHQRHQQQQAAAAAAAAASQLSFAGAVDDNNDNHGNYDDDNDDDGDIDDSQCCCHQSSCCASNNFPIYHHSQSYNHPHHHHHHHHNHHHNHNLYQRSQCLATNSINTACQQSTTGSLLDKFGASIAPTTVAQIGISRCTATGLYTYAGLLIIFGFFIFVLELVTVSGLL